MEEINRMESEAGKTRAKLEAVIERAKEAGTRLQEQAAAAAKATDKVIRENPYQALGVAFGVGVLVGVLVGQAGLETAKYLLAASRPAPNQLP